MVLAESPLWDHRFKTLRWVDIPEAAIHSLGPGGSRSRIDLRHPIGCVGMAGTDRLVVGTGREVVTIGHHGQYRDVVRLAKPARRGMRMNDGAVDGSGRFWVGSLPNKDVTHRGALFRVSEGGMSDVMVTPVARSNGIGWSPDETLMYYIDTPTGSVDVFDFDAGSGAIGNRRVFVRIPEDEGNPDGLTVDAAGNVWVALWDGGRLICFSPAGYPINSVTVPVSNVTSACFGGDDLGDLYITTARSDPGSPSSGGAVYVTRPGTYGMRSSVFGQEATDA